MASQYVKILAALGFASATAAIAVSGCELIASVDRTQIATGGTTSVGGTGGVAGTGGTGGTACDPAQCPGSDTDCHHRICDNNVCSVQNENPGTTCANTPPDDGKVCDGSGACVECNGNADCTSPEICDVPNHLCVPPTCQNNTLDPGETGIDCGGNAVSGCGPCANGRGCDVAVDCTSGFCDTTGGGGQGGAGAAGVCAACTLDNQCGATQWCDTTVNTGTCVAKKPNGDACGGDNECTNGHCPSQDSVCCDAACTGSVCQSCLAAKTGGTTGVCSFVTAGQDFDTECTDAGVATCGANGTGCTGTSAACNLYPNAAVCTPESCTGSTDSPAELCNGTGTCVNSGTNACPNNLTCNAGGTACRTTCTPDTDCVTGFFCNAGTCTAKKADGLSCGGDNQCINAHCADGVCCNTACGNACDACTAALKGTGADGVCGNSAAGSAGSPSCTPYLCTGVSTVCLTQCAGDANCISGDYCDGAAQCVPKLAQGSVCNGNNECSNGNCVDGFCCNNACAGTCVACSAAKKGAGANGTCGQVGAGTDPDNECNGGTPFCDGASSLCVLCAIDSNCLSTEFCTAGNICQTKGAYDAACSGANQCQSGFCGHTGNANACGCAGPADCGGATPNCDGTHTCVT